jgi:hypothetical protein
MGKPVETFGYFYVGIETVVDSNGFCSRYFAFPALTADDWTRASAWAAEYPGRMVASVLVASPVLTKPDEV